MLVTTTRVPRHLILQLPFGRKKHNPLKSLKPFWASLLGSQEAALDNWVGWIFYRSAPKAEITEADVERTA